MTTSNPTPRQFDEINDATGFANGAEFQTEAEVREYFTVASMAAMFNDYEGNPDAATLDAMADAVIANRWHCAF